MIQDLIQLIGTLPGLGLKSAKRITLHLMKNDAKLMVYLASQLQNVAQHIKTCNICGNIGENSPCEICTSNRRDRTKICIIEDMSGLWNIESSEHYNGLYHVLSSGSGSTSVSGPHSHSNSHSNSNYGSGSGSNLGAQNGAATHGDNPNSSSMQSGRPTDLSIHKLLNRLTPNKATNDDEQAENVTEVIFAHSPTAQGQITAFYVMDAIEKFTQDNNLNIKITALGHGLPIGSDIDYLDENTISAAFKSRKDFS